MLQLESLRKAFGKTTAVDGLSLSVRAGEVYGLLGPNGAGKSTTISMAAGLLVPDAGSVRVGRELGDPREANVRRLIGIAPQSISLYDQLTGSENLAFFGKIYGLAGTELVKRVAEVLSYVELADRGSDRVAGYSGGMKRRLNLAAAIMHRPQIVFMDEPTAGVDPQSRAAIFDIVSQLKRDGIAVVYSTHYMEEAERMCDRIGIIDHGKLLVEGSVEYLVKQHGGVSTLEITRTDQAIERIESHNPTQSLLQAASSGSAIAQVRILTPNLESVFLKLTGRTLRDTL